MRAGHGRGQPPLSLRAHAWPRAADRGHWPERRIACATAARPPVLVLVLVPVLVLVLVRCAALRALLSPLTPRQART
jgi:hypothetical protein